MRTIRRERGVLLALLVFVTLSVRVAFSDDLADARALVLAARHFMEIGEAESAAATFQQAIEKMQAAHETAEFIFPILIDLSSAYLEMGNLSQAERILMTADEMEVKSPHPIWRAELTNNRVCVHIKLGRYTEAKAESERAIHLIEDLPAASAAMMPNLLDDLATSEIYLGQPQQALRHQQDAIQRWKTILPADHPDLIKAYSVLATAQFLCGQFKDARGSLETAIDSGQRTYGERSPLFARLLQDEIIVLTRLGLKREIKVRQRQLSRISGGEQTQSAVYTRAASAIQSLPQ